MKPSKYVNLFIAGVLTSTSVAAPAFNQEAHQTHQLHETQHKNKILNSKKFKSHPNLQKIYSFSNNKLRSLKLLRLI